MHSLKNLDTFFRNSYEKSNGKDKSVCTSKWEFPAHMKPIYAEPKKQKIFFLIFRDNEFGTIKQELLL